VYNFYSKIFAKKQAVCYNIYVLFHKKTIKKGIMEKVHFFYNFLKIRFPANGKTARSEKKRAAL